MLCGSIPKEPEMVDKPGTPISRVEHNMMDINIPGPRSAFEWIQKYLLQIDISKLIGEMRFKFKEHPYLCTLFGFAILFLLLPLTILIGIFITTLILTLMGFIFVEGTLLTIGTIMLGSSFIILGFIGISVVFGMGIMWYGCVNVLSYINSFAQKYHSNYMPISKIKNCNSAD